MLSLTSNITNSNAKKKHTKGLPYLITDAQITPSWIGKNIQISAGLKVN